MSDGKTFSLEIEEKVETSDESDEPLPDSLECEWCGAEIPHDHFLYFVEKGFNMHGAPMSREESDIEKVCENCIKQEKR